MARDRKRAKQRQRRRTADRQPQRVSARRDADAPERARPEAEDAGDGARPDAEAAKAAAPDRVAARRDPDAAPPPLEDSSAEVEIAEAAMVDPPEAELEPDEAPAPDELEEIDGQPDDRSAIRAARGPDEVTSLVRGPAARAVSGAELPAEGNRFANFLRACAAELRRVQWPDRRQVAQATGVVLGFVILAGAYLGLLDAAFSRLVNAIL